jgi:hypothetical protein
MKANFFIVGPPKCASSSLHYYVNQHPEIFMSEIKETHFFGTYYDKDEIGSYEEAHFTGSEAFPIRGESTPTYSFLPLVPKRLYDYNPDAKMVFIFRDPVDRAFSGWLMQNGTGVEKEDFPTAIDLNFKQQKELDFHASDFELKWKRDQYLRKNKNKLEIRTFLEAGLYADQMKRYLEVFPAEQIHVVIFDDIRKDLDGVIKGISTFLGIDDSFVLKDKEVKNPYTTRRFTGLYRTFGAERLAKWAKVMPPFIQPMLRSVSKKKEVNKPKADDVTKARLREYFKESNLELSKMIGRDLSHWNK